MRLLTWNVDGLRRAGVADTVVQLCREARPHLAALNEIKCDARAAAHLLSPLTDEGYRLLCNPCGGGRLSAAYHGVALLVAPHVRVERGSEMLRLPHPPDLEARLAADGEARQMLHHEGRCIGLRAALAGEELVFYLFTYVPNAGTSGLKRLELRTEVWDACVRHVLRGAREDGDVVWAGDLNVVRDPSVDVHTGRARRYAGMTREERNSFEEIVGAAGLRDPFVNTDTRDRFTFFSARSAGARAGCKGWRLDYVLASAEGWRSWTLPCEDERAAVSDHNPLFAECGEEGDGDSDGDGGEVGEGDGDEAGEGDGGGDGREGNEVHVPVPPPSLNDTERHMMDYLESALHSVVPGGEEHRIVHGAVRHLLGDRYFAWWSNAVVL